MPQIWANLKLQKISSTYTDWDQKPDVLVRKNILGIVKRILPSSIYYCLSGQITIWLISFFGSTVALAQLGALSRLSMVISMFGTLFTTLIVPRFARLPSIPSLILKRFSFIQVGLIVKAALIVCIVGLFSQEILWILGNNYSGLTKEVILITISSCLSLVSVSTNQLLSARGIVAPPMLFIPCALIIQIGLVFTVHLNEVEDVLLYSIYTSIFTYIFRLIHLILTFGEHEFNKEVKNFL